MAIAFSALVVRHERRIRLLFSQALGAGAFGPGSALGTLYVVTCTDGSGGNPNVAAAIAVPSATTNVDLALDCDLVAGGTYQVATLGVPGADASTSAAAVGAFVFGALTAPTQNVELHEDDIETLVYGVDLVWTGADFLETPAGDLATVQGVPNVQGAIQRRLLDEDGLPWDPTYGAKSANYVNGPAPNGLGLVGSLRRQAVSDDRVQSASVTWTEDPASPGDNYFPVTIVFRGAQAGGGFTFNVNPPGTS